MKKLIIILLVFLVGCDLFTNRDPEKPDSARSNYLPATTPDILFSNLKNSLQEKVLENYMSSFVDPSFISIPFIFIPTSEAIVKFPALNGWNLDSERQYFNNLINSTKQNTPIILDLQNEIKNIGKSDDLGKLDEKKEELRNLKILTEDDWVKFKSIFKDVYSEQTLKIDHLSPNLSEGDKRQLMLIKLGFSINQSAEILGVGYRAIQKARQRLAQKLNLKSSKDISNIING